MEEAEEQYPLESYIESRWKNDIKYHLLEVNIEALLEPHNRSISKDLKIRALQAATEIALKRFQETFQDEIKFYENILYTVTLDQPSFYTPQKTMRNLTNLEEILDAISDLA